MNYADIKNFDAFNFYLLNMITRSSDKPAIPLALIGIMVIAVTFIGYNIYTAFSPRLVSPVSNSANFTIGAILLEPANCQDCFQLINLTNSLFQNNFERVSFSDQRGKDLAGKYSVSKLPALIIFDASKVQDPQFQPLLVSRLDALILESPVPPFVEVATGDVKGKVTSYSISSSNCSQCVRSSDFIKEVKDNGAAIQNQELAGDSSKAHELIVKYNLTFLPAFIFSRDLLEYSQFKQSWSILGSIENDGYLVMRQPLPPYVNLSNNQTEGLVNAVYLTDDTCATCYNVSIHKAAMESYKVFIATELYVSVASLEGQALVEKYNLTKVPTLILSKEAGVYFALNRVWSGIGSVESDGVFIFRKFDTVPGIIYKDLSTNSVVTVPQ